MAVLQMIQFWQSFVVVIGCQKLYRGNYDCGVSLINYSKCQYFLLILKLSASPLLFLIHTIFFLFLYVTNNGSYKLCDKIDLFMCPLLPFNLLCSFILFFFGSTLLILICIYIFVWINRSSEMLIAFHSSPYSAPLQTGTPNRGFELNVDILFTDSDSYNFMQNVKCEFHINASSPGKSDIEKLLCIFWLEERGRTGGVRKFIMCKSSKLLMSFSFRHAICLHFVFDFTLLWISNCCVHGAIREMNENVLVLPLLLMLSLLLLLFVWFKPFIVQNFHTIHKFAVK